MPTSSPTNFAELGTKLAPRQCRSPLSVNRAEILAGTLAAVVALLYVHWNLWSLEPFGYSDADPSPYPGWFVDGREELFRRAIYFNVPIMALAGISFIRFLRDDVYGFTRHGHIALTAPLLALLFTGCFSPIIDVIGLALAIVAATRALRERKFCRLLCDRRGCDMAGH